MRVEKRHPVDLMALLWSVFFALVHLYWGLGGTVGLGRRVTGILLVINWLATGLCFLAAWVAYQSLDRRRSPGRRRLYLFLSWSAAFLLGARGLVGMIQNTFQDRSGMPWGVVLADPFFLLGGVLFAGVGWLWWRSTVTT